MLCVHKQLPFSTLEKEICGGKQFRHRFCLALERIVGGRQQTALPTSVCLVGPSHALTGMAGGRDTWPQPLGSGALPAGSATSWPQRLHPKHLPSYDRVQVLCPDPQELTPGPAKHSSFLLSTPSCPRRGLRSCSRLPRYCPAQFLPAISREVGYDI